MDFAYTLVCILVPSNDTVTSGYDMLVADDVHVNLMLEYMLLMLEYMLLMLEYMLLMLEYMLLMLLMLLMLEYMLFAYS